MLKRRNTKLDEVLNDQPSSKILNLNKRKLIPLLIFLLLTLFFLFARIFTVSKIEVVLNNIDCTNEETIKSSKNILGKNIFLLKKEIIENEIKTKYLCIKNAEVEKKYPNKIKLDLENRVAKVNLRIKSEAPKLLSIENLEATPSSSAAILDTNFDNLQFDKSLVVDEEGFAFSNYMEGQNLPIIYLSDHELDLGKIAKGEIKVALGILNKLKNANLEIKESKISNSIFIINGPKRIIFDLKKDATKQVTSLQLILQKATIDSKELSLVDLRFDKPVVKYSGKK